MKDWQRGYDLDLLRSISQRFAQHDGARTLGAFSRARENVVAEWLASGRLATDLDVPALVVARRSRTRQRQTDFRGEAVADIPVGTLIVERVAGSAADICAEIERLASNDRILWRRWADHPEEIEASRRLELQPIGSTISASSEIRRVDARGIVPTSIPSAADLVGIAAIALDPPSPADLERLALWPALVAQRWKDHYSSYNKRRSWHAVALRSFGGSETFIEKPAEMSRRWKSEHPESLTSPILDTALLDELPGARALLDRIPADLERVRLMRLDGGGELSRHADITDRSAGTRDGAIARLHLPIVTDQRVMFETWDLSNRSTSVHMEAGRWWYLDVRKPHRATNDAGADRIHLVVDVVVNSEIREALTQ